MRSIYLFFSILLLLSGCSALSRYSEKYTLKQHSHPQGITDIGIQNNWNLEAQFAIRNETDAWSGRLHWQQRGRCYQLKLFGPFPGGLIYIYGQPGSVKLVKASRRTIHSTSATQLVQEQTGWKLPINELSYWVIGLPEPNSPSKKIFDHEQHLIELSQSGWKVTYAQYTSDKSIHIPRKIEISQPPLRIKIIVSNWQLFA